MTAEKTVFTSLEHANITVKDPTALAEQLCPLFDWHIRWSGESLYGGHTVHVGNDEFYLALYSRGGAESENTDLGSYQRENGLNHIGMVVSDLDAMERRVVKAGFKPHMHGDYEPGRRFYFTVTGGLEFEMVSYAKTTSAAYPASAVVLNIGWSLAMLFSGSAFSLSSDNGILTLNFDLADSKVNVFNALSIKELGEALDIAEKQPSVKGLMITSGKAGFIAGADITEFTAMFASSGNELAELIKHATDLFNRIEDFQAPTVALINGEAQGGGCEITLACDFRVMAENARIGVPEVKLGILPGWGGTVRLSRLMGVDNAVEWMCTGSSKRASDALKDGAVDAVVAADQLAAAGEQMIESASSGKLPIEPRRTLKKGPLMLSPIEKAMAFQSAKGVVGAKAGPNYPAPLTIIDTIEAHADLARDEALGVEAASFIKLSRTDACSSLIGIFLKDQQINRLARGYRRAAGEVKQAAVLGAGIMGGGVAYQSASNGVPILMKDIRQEALDDGLAEAGKLLNKQLERGKVKPAGAMNTLNSITPVLSYGEFDSVDLLVEAVVENPKIKQSVLAEVEQQVSDDTIITSNTSTISINLLASALKRPENFCGMHFFNPVHRMPLVEIIRADSSSETAIATTVAYALKMKKTPIVVNDCPGFLVNRILFAYFSGYSRLISDGGDVHQIDKVMERYGWPMGPAYLLDVVGMDTAKHAGDVMAEGFPDRMSTPENSVIDAMFNANRFGQKNGLGFFKYETDKRGRPKKLRDEEADALVASVQSSKLDISDEDIIDRLMIPMTIEAVRCVEDNIVSTPAEADMGLVYGLGYPPFRGGVLHSVDKQGVKDFCDRANALKDLGPLYHVTEGLQKMAAENATFYPENGAGAKA